MLRSCVPDLPTPHGGGTQSAAHFPTFVIPHLRAHTEITALEIFSPMVHSEYLS